MGTNNTKITKPCEDISELASYHVGKSKLGPRGL